MTIEDWQIQAEHFDSSEPFVPAQWKVRQQGFKYFYILKDYAIAEAIQSLKLAPGSMVLDAGCGTGVILDRLQSSYGTKNFGIDVSAKSLTRHRHSGQGGNRNSLADARQIPLADNVFDLAISLDVLEHMQSPEDAVREMMRITRPGGWVVLYAVSRENRFTWIWMLTSFYEFLGINHWSWSCHNPDLLVDPNSLLSTLAGVSCEVRTAERFHSFFSLILDHFLQAIWLVAEKLRLTSRESQSGDRIATVMLVVSSLVCRAFLPIARRLDRPWSSRGLSNGILVVAQKRENSAHERQGAALRGQELEQAA